VHSLGVIRSIARLDVTPPAPVRSLDKIGVPLWNRKKGVGIEIAGIFG
jgi:hypothetical protein